MGRIIDLFSGVGGLSYGFEQAGFEVLLANEIDQEIADAYIKNHPSVRMINEDITSLEISNVFGELRGQVDVVIGGPPCQGFSQKGARRLIDDERNFLFKYYFQVVNYLKPTYFLMENVPNLLTANNGYFKQEITSLFHSIGYRLDAAVLNATDFGVPQMRKRAFILGKLEQPPVALPIGVTAPVSVSEAISDLAYLESGEGSEMQAYHMPPHTEYQKRMRYHSELLYNHVATKHSKLTLERLQMIPVGMGKEVLPQNHLTKSIYSGTWCRMIEDQPSVTITTRFDTPSSGRFTHPFLNRAITVREAARLQSFPDHFVFWGSKSSQMKQVGNAVPPLLAQAIAEVIKTDMGIVK